MKTKIWRDLTYDLKIEHSERLGEYTLCRFISRVWTVVIRKKTMKEILEVKHLVISNKLRSKYKY